VVKGLYYYRSHGVVRGPVSLDSVMRMVREKSLSTSAEISADRIAWKSISDAGLLGGASIYTPPAHDARIASGAASVMAVSATNRNREEFDPSPLLSGVRHRWRISFIVAMGVIPLLISYAQNVFGLRFHHVAWLFSFYFCVLWAWIAGLMMEWRTEVWRRAIACGLFTAFAGILLLYVWHHVPVVAMLYEGIGSDRGLLRATGFILGVGLMEELCKSLPLLLFCMAPRTILSPNDGLFYGMISGLGFAAREGVEYTYEYWIQAAGQGLAGFSRLVDMEILFAGGLTSDDAESRMSAVLSGMLDQYGEIVTIQFVRFMSLPLLHAAWAGLVGYCFARALLGGGKWIIFWAGVLTAAILHGSYNYFAGSPVSILIVAITISLPIFLVIRTRKFRFVRHE